MCDTATLITEYQKDLMTHTMSDGGRNWFGTSKGGKDYVEFEKLVDLGLATRHDAPSFWGDDYVYRLTEKGKQAI